MKVLLAGALALVASSTVAAAQQAPAPATSNQSTPAGNVPIETLMASPATKAAVLKQFPDLEKHPAYETFKSISLRDLAPLSGGAVTEDKIVAVEAELKNGK